MPSQGASACLGSQGSWARAVGGQLGFGRLERKGRNRSGLGGRDGSRSGHKGGGDLLFFFFHFQTLINT